MQNKKPITLRGNDKEGKVDNNVSCHKFDTIVSISEHQTMISENAQFIG